MTVIFGVLGFGAWKYYQYTQQQILIYATNAAQAEQAAIESDAAMKAIKQDLEQVQKQFNEVSKEFAQAQSRVDTLEKKLSKHDLGQLAQAKPGLVEKIVNSQFKFVKDTMATGEKNRPETFKTIQLTHLGKFAVRKKKIEFYRKKVEMSVPEGMEFNKLYTIKKLKL